MAVKMVTYLLMPATAWATSITLHESLIQVPLLSWLMVLVLSTVWGLAALLTRLRDATEVRRPWLFASAVQAARLAPGVAARAVPWVIGGGRLG